MLELVSTASIISIMVFFASRHFRSQGNPFVFDSAGWYEEYLAAGDLPCPWCQAHTREADQVCPSCERVFGEPVSS